MNWLSTCLPAYCVEEFGRAWLNARVAQHRTRCRFPNARPGHALPQSDSVQSAPVRQGAKVRAYPPSTPAYLGSRR